MNKLEEYQGKNIRLLNNELIKEHIIFEINKNLRILSRCQLEKIYSNSTKIKPTL